MSATLLQRLDVSNEPRLLFSIFFFFLFFSFFFSFFLKLKELFGRYRFARTDDLKDCVRRQLCKLAGELYDEGI